MSVPRVLGLLALACLASSCGAPGPGEGGAGADEANFGLVVLTDQARPEQPVGRAQLTAMAYFVDAAGVDERAVLDMLNLQVPTEGHRAERDACKLDLRPLPDGGAVAAPDAVITFMDAGRLSVHAPQQQLTLEGAYLPDVFANVSGVVYDAVQRDGVGLRAGAVVRVVGHGSADVGTFVAETSSPAAIRLTSVAGQPVRRERMELAPDELFSSDGLDVTWQAGRLGDGAAIIELSRRGFGDVAVVRCPVVDDGFFHIPGDLLARVPDLGPEQVDRLDAYRVAAAEFTAEGLRLGRLLVATRDTVHLD